MLAFLLAAQLVLAHASALDADTLRAGGVDYRLYGVDAPEIHLARCPAERALGEAAAARVRALLAGAGQVTAIPGFDPPGRRVWPRDGFGRRLARVEIDGADLGALLVEEGLARPRLRGAAKPDWC